MRASNLAPFGPLWVLVVVTAISLSANHVAGAEGIVAAVGCGDDCGYCADCACRDDYCCKPWKPPCNCPSPYYRCVAAGDCPCRAETRKHAWSWWFIPKPEAFRAAIRFNR